MTPLGTTTEPGSAHEPTPTGSHPFYTMFSVLRVSSSHSETFDGSDVERIVREIEDVIDVVKEEDVTLRGFYDVSGTRADADLMIWLHGSAAEDLQWALRELRRTALLKPLIRVWSAVGIAREPVTASAGGPIAETSTDPMQWLAVSPVTRSHDWQKLDADARSRLASDRATVAAEFPAITSQSFAALGFGDHELLLTAETDELAELADMLRAVRTIDAHANVLEATSFFTGRRLELAEIVEVLQ